MAHDVFISYAPPDRAVADAVCAALERRRIRCWIAPRDAQGGASYAPSVIDAISVSRFMVLVLSSSSNDSARVIREVERAASGGPVVIPFRIEDVSLSKPLQAFLGPARVVDALTPPMEEPLSRLADHVELLLKPTGTVSSRRGTGWQAGPAPRPQPAPGRRSGAAPRPQPGLAPPRGAPSPQPAPGPRPRTAPPPRPAASLPLQTAPPRRSATSQAVSAVAQRARGDRAVWFASLGAAAGGLVSLAALFVYPTIDSAGALAAFWVSGAVVAGAVTACWLHGSRRRPAATAWFGTVGGLIIGGLVEWVSAYAFAISSGDAALWIVASAVLWGAYGWHGAGSVDRGGRAQVGFDAVRTLVGVSVIRFLAIGVFRSEWVWVLWFHDALQAVGWRFGLAAAGPVRTATSPSI